jgi:hypothetical protein
MDWGKGTGYNDEAHGSHDPSQDYATQTWKFECQGKSLSHQDDRLLKSAVTNVHVE